MFNWNVDEERFKNSYPEGYKLWRLSQLINYGLDREEKFNKKEIKKVWQKIKENIDPLKNITVDFLFYRGDNISLDY